MLSGVQSLPPFSLVYLGSDTTDAVAALAVKTDSGMTLPQLPSSASGARPVEQPYQPKTSNRRIEFYRVITVHDALFTSQRSPYRGLNPHW